MAVSLDAAADAVLSTASLPSATAYTACGWFVLSTDRNDYSCLIALDNNTGGGSSTGYINVQTDIDGTSLVAYTDSPTGPGYSMASIATLSVGTPFFVAVTAAGTGAADVKVYYRTESQNSFSSGSLNGVTFTPAQIVFGNSQFTNTFWNGRIWNAKVWDRALSASELLVESYYRRVMFPASINRHWLLSDASDTADYSGNGRSATFNGTLATADGSQGLWKPRTRRITVTSSGYTLTAVGGTYTLTGQAAALRGSRAITAAQGSYALTGQAGALRAARRIAAEQGSYVLTGQAAALRAARAVAAPFGSYSLTGQAAALRVARQLVAGQGAYALTGQAAGMAFGHKLAAAQGGYTLSGQAAGLQYSGSSPTLTASAGFYVLTGQAVTLRAARRLTAAHGTYTLTGQSVALSRGRLLACLQGSYALTGFAAVLQRSLRMAALHGTYALTGQAVTLSYSAAPPPAVSGWRSTRARFGIKRTPQLSRIRRG